jgi:hypothetical protein
MGKSNRVKQHQTTATFPFNLLMFWIRISSVHGKQCHVCQQSAEYEIDHFVNPQPPSAPDGIDRVWSEAVKGQMSGKHTNYLTTYNCASCTRRYLRSAGGDNVADLSMLYTTVARERVSLAVGCTVQSLNDDGKPFVAHLSVSSLDSLVQQFQSNNAVHIKLKG